MGLRGVSQPPHGEALPLTAAGDDHTAILLRLGGSRLVSSHGVRMGGGVGGVSKTKFLKQGRILMLFRVSNLLLKLIEDTPFTQAY